MISEIEKEQLKLMMLLKHGSLLETYREWLLDDAELTDDELLIIAREYNIAISEMHQRKMNIQRSMHGIYR